jgi:O-antigen ligase
MNVKEQSVFGERQHGAAFTFRDTPPAPANEGLGWRLRTGNRRYSHRLIIVIVVPAVAVLLFLLNSRDQALQISVLVVLSIVGLYQVIRYAFREPRWYICALMLEETVPYFNVIPVSPESRWFLRYPLLFPLALPALWSTIKTGILFEGRFGLMVMYFGWSAVTVAYSLDPGVSVGRLVPDFLLFSTLCYVGSNIRSADDVQEVLGRFVLACGLLQLLTAVAYLFLPEVLGGTGETLRATWMIDERGLARFCGVFNEPNAVGSLMLATVGSGVAHWSAVRTRWRRLLLAFSMAAGVFFAIAADSRSETFVAVLGCTSYAIWQYRWKALVTVGLFIILACGCFYALKPEIQPYLNRGLDTMTGRTEAWDFEVAKAEANPFLGYGYQSEGEILRDRHFNNWQDIWGRGAYTPLHNGYMTLIIGTGIPATIFWLSIFLGPWWQLIRDREDPWKLKPLALLVILPALLLALDESGLSEPRSVRGLLLYVSWTIAERYQIVSRQTRQSAAEQRDDVVDARSSGLKAGALMRGKSVGR